jgi:hypothetical protein
VTRIRKGLVVLFVAIGSAAIVLVGAGAARSQTNSCDSGSCSSQSDASDNTGDPNAVFVEHDGGNATVSNQSGAVLVHDDGGNPTVDNNSGAVNVETDGGSPTVNNDTGAVDVEANGGSPTVNNGSGAVLVEGAPSLVPAVRTPVFLPSLPAPAEQFFEQPTRLPVTGASVQTVLLMAFAMMAFGAVLLGAVRLVPARAPIAQPRTALTARSLLWL